MKKWLCVFLILAMLVSVNVLAESLFPSLNGANEQGQETASSTEPDEKSDLIEQPSGPYIQVRHFDQIITDLSEVCAKPIAKEPPVPSIPSENGMTDITGYEVYELDGRHVLYLRKR